MSDSPAAALRRHAREHLPGLPDAVIDAYVAFAPGRDPAALDAVVFGILEHHRPVPPRPQPPRPPLAAEPDSARLAADLGLDSLAMVESVFLLEGLLGVKLAEQEMARLATLGELRQFLRKKVAER